MERAVREMEGRTLLRLYPPPLAEVPAVHIYADLDAHSAPPDPGLPYVRLNMVSSLDGKAAVGGKAAGIGSAADRLIMDALRSGADAVMVGAGTLRAERMTLGVSRSASARRTSAGRSPQPLAVVAAGASDIGRTIQENLIQSKPDNTLMLIPDEGMPDEVVSGSDERPGGQGHSREVDTEGGFGVEERGACGTPAPGESLAGYRTVAVRAKHTLGGRVALDLRAALHLLRRAYGVRSLLVEGGPKINGQLVAEGLVSEALVTLAPKILGSPSDHENPPSIIEGLHLAPRPGEGPEAARGLTLISVHLFESELFLRYAFGEADG